MNIKELADRLELEEEEYRELLVLFFETGKDDLKKLQSALNEGNIENIIDISHSFKGASGNMGFMELHQALEQIEYRADSNQMVGLAELFGGLKMKFEELKKLM